MRTSFQCVDDFGCEVHKCRFTGVPVSVVEGVVVGATIPGVKTKHLMANTPEAWAAKKQSDRWFAESEANCNTCKHLQRVAHEKSHGFLQGRCTSDKQDVASLPYKMRGDVMVFHPSDWMGMNCYEPRWNTAPVAVGG